MTLSYHPVLQKRAMVSSDPIGAVSDVFHPDRNKFKAQTLLLMRGEPNFDTMTLCIYSNF